MLLDLLGSEPTPEAATCMADRVAEGLGVAAPRVRAWALVRAVASAMWSLDDGDDPRQDIATAALLGSLR